MDAFVLLASIKMLESPIKWVEEIQEKSLKPDEFSKIVEQAKSGRFDYNFDEDETSRVIETSPFSYHLPRIYTHVFEKINLSVLLVFARDTEKALSYLKQVQYILDKLTGDHRNVCKVVELVVKIIEMAIDVIDTDVDTSGIEQMSNEWNNLAGKPKYAAVIQFMKLTLNMSMGVLTTNDAINQLKNISKLDPDYFLWHHYLYRLVRHERLQSQKGIESGHISPGELEKLAATTAHKLRSSVLLNIFWTGKMLQSTLWRKCKFFKGETDKWNEEDEKVFTDCEKLLSNALQLAKFEGFENLAEKIREEQARSLSYLKHEDLDCVLKGQQLIKDSYLEYPKSYMFSELHARNQFSLFREAEEATKNNFKTAFEAHQFNSSLLMRYLDFLAFSPLTRVNDYYELHKVIKNAISKCHGLKHEADLLTLHGCLIFAFNPEKLQADEEYTIACKLWVETLTKFPNEKENILNILKDPPFYRTFYWGRKIKCKVNHMELVIELNQLRQELEKDKGNRDEKTLQAIFNLWVLGEMEIELPSAPPHPVERDIVERNSLLESSQDDNDSGPWRRAGSDGQSSSRTYGRAWEPTSQRTISDSDNNWRSGPRRHNQQDQ